jgi:phenylalanyl-tRNA synthetase beta chain
MKVSLSWLKDYVPIELEPKVLADALTMVGLEVEAIWDRYSYLNQVLVCRVLDVSPHPDADRLTCCLVDVGTHTLSVVCGAPNVRKGMLAALALPGMILPSGMEIKESVIRGQLSEGMLCSSKELALGEDGTGIMMLTEDVAVGTPLNRALSYSDMVFEIGLTPNRPDCTGIIGIAREIAAIQKIPMRHPKITLEETVGPTSNLTSVTIEEPVLCPRYAAKLIRDITVGPSPDWLKDRLLSVGQRPINNIVDVTNFVMLETGQPLHAFDFSFLEGGRIVVRTAKEGEPFTTLDGKQRFLSEQMLLICDASKPIALAGVMGGENSEIKNTTTTVLIESAYFNPVSVRKTSKQLGLGTDASYRFERGVDPHGTIRSLLRAAELMVLVSGGTDVGGVIDMHPRVASHQQISLKTGATNRLLGTDLSRENIISLLSGIEIGCDQSASTESTDQMAFSVPSYRVDLKRPEDLMEEVARLYGYENIPTTLPVMAAAVSAREKTTPRELRETCREKMVGFGFSEAITYSFINPESAEKLLLSDSDPRRRTVAILNPLTEDQAVMRASLVPGLLETMGRNLSKQVKTLRLFEVGKVFLDRGVGMLPEEREMVAALLTGDRSPAAWCSKVTPCDFFDMKGAVSALLTGLDLKEPLYTKERTGDAPYLRPGHVASISVDGTTVGIVGEVHPKVLSAYELKQTAFIFELFLQRISEHPSVRKKVSGISRYPSVARDVTLIIDKQIESHRILDRVKTMEANIVEGVQLFDVFMGETIPEGKKSVSFRITYRSADQTLEDESVNRIHAAICDKVIKDFCADLP